MDRRAWQATVHGVIKSWTQLKQLSVHASNQLKERSFKKKKKKKKKKEEVKKEYERKKKKQV